MEDKPTKRSGTVIVIALAAVLVVLSMLYALSMGPALWMINHGWLDPTWAASPVAVAYRPLQWVENRVPIIGPTIATYTDWWLPAGQFKPPASAAGS